jgi:hypothetical protein
MLEVTLIVSCMVLAPSSYPATQKALPITETPFELISGYIIFPIIMETSDSMNFLFDTGCQTTVFSEEVHKKSGNAPTIVLTVGSLEIEIDTFHFRSLANISKRLGKTIGGVIGNDILHNFTVTLDFRRSLIGLHDSGGLVANPEGEDIKIGVNPLISSLPLEITFPTGQLIVGNFVIDTGAPISVLLNSPIAKEHGLNVDPNTNKEFKTQEAVQTAAEIQADVLQVGGFKLSDVSMFVSTTDKGLFAVTAYAGIVGTGLLRNFNVIFDYERERINLERLKQD